jgi:ribosomal protein S3
LRKQRILIIYQSQIILNVLKVQNPASASIIADSLIEQLEQKVPFRAALKNL